jgi:hypothetical protein
MQTEFDMGWSGSLTVLTLFITVAVLLRSFYKRYQRMNPRNDENQSDS